MKRVLLIAMLLLGVFELRAQCNSNVSICTQGVAGPFNFDQTTPGPPTDYANPTLCSTGLFGNPSGFGFIVLHITQSGPLNLLVDGNATTGFIDVVVYDIPNGMDPCVAALDPANEIGCNYATGAVGCTQFGNDFPCTSSIPAPNVVAGQDIMIIVHDYSTASSTFTLDLGPTGAQTGPADGTITPVGTVCNTDPAFQMNAANNGGVWTGNGISANGMFDPATAGIGTHTIDYTVGSVPCDGQGQTTITVIDCANPCLMTSLNASIGACEPGNVFTVTGDFTFNNSPTTGNIVVEVTNGSGTYTQTFGLPFNDGQLYNFSVGNIPSDGTPLTVTVYFSDDTACTISVNSTSPASCACNADIGTFSSTTQGTQNGDDFVLCWGQTLDITSNGDWTAPDEATNPPGPPYTPGIGWLVYSCPPTVGLVPDPNNPITNDPCLEFLLTGPDFNEINDQWWLDQATNNAQGGTPTNNTLYFVPITLYSTTNNPIIYSYVNTSMPCYEMGDVYSVQYLDEVIENTVEDCTAGTVTTTISGGQPAVDGSNFTAQNLTPATASFVQNTAANGGDIIIGGLVDGDVYSYDIVDANGCQVTITGTFVGLEDPAFTYPSAMYCQDEPNPTPTITGDPGGAFTSTVGLSINAATGQINLGASTPGTYTVTYTTQDLVCFASATFDVTINPLPTVTSPDVSVCEGSTITLTASGADTYVWASGTFLSTTTGTSVDCTPTITTVYTITGSMTATGCSNTGAVTVTVDPLDDASFTTTDYCEGTAAPVATITGTGGGLFTFSPLPGDGATINGATGAITNGVGGTTYTIDYTTNGICPQSSTQTVTVNALPLVDVPDYSVCTGGTVALTATGADSYIWTPGTYLNTTTGASVDCTPVAGITYTVTGTDANGCQNTDQTTVTVIPNAPIDAGPDVAICFGESTTLTATGGVTYNWQAPISAAGDVQTVIPTTTTTYTVDGVDAAGCTGTDQITVTVNPLPIVDAGSDQTVCEGGQVTLTGAGAGAGGTYAWDNGVIDNQAFNPPVGTTTTYTVNGTDANGCVNTDQVDVTVNPLPIINAGPDQTVCEGVQVTLAGSGAGTGGTYTWDNGINDNVAFNAPIGTTTTYTVTGTDATGCQNTDQVDVTVNALPVINAGLDQTVCDGIQVTLAGTGAGAGGMYAWGNGITDNQAFNQPVSTVVYTVTGTDANGCQNTDQVSVTVNPNPIPVINGATTYCQGTFSTLSTSTPFTTYNWSTGANTPTVNVTDADNPITVTVTNVFGCSGTSQVFTVMENNVITYNSTVEICQGESALIHGNNETVAGVYSQTFMLTTGCDSISNVTLIVNALPNVNGGPDQTVCDGVSTTLTASGAATLTWDNGITNGNQFTQAVGSMNYTVTGTDINGCVNTDIVNVTVNPLPAVDAGPDQTVCEGVQVTLAGAGANTYVWNNGVIDNQAFNAPIGTTTPYIVTGMDANGCVNTDNVNVTVNALPTVNAGPDQTVCEGVQVAVSGSGANTYVWDNGVIDGQLFNAPIGATTPYIVTGTDANGCVNTDVVNITVNALPVVDAGPDQAMCDGSMVTMSATGPAGMGMAWDNGVVDGQPFAQSAGTTMTYVVTGTDINGCQNTDQADVTVHPLPMIDAGPDQAMCDGILVTLSGFGADATGNYSWDNGVVDGQAFSAPVGATTTYTLTGTDANGCVNTDQVDVTVHVLPTVFAGNDFIICEGASAILTGAGAVTYNWDNGVVNAQPFSPSNTATYTVIGIDANGCEGTDDVVVTIEPLPVVSFLGDNLSGCEPLTVTFTNTTPGNLMDCIWTIPGATLYGCDSVTYTFTNPGTYDITLTTTSANGCTNSATYTDYIYVEGTPIASFIPSSTVVNNLNTEVHFENTSSGASSYEWDFGDGSLTESTVSPTHNFPDTEAGTYTVQLIALSPLECADTAYATIEVDEEVIFYVPNTFTPDNDDYNEVFQPVFNSGYDPYDFDLFIFDRWGETIFESHNADIGWDGTYGGGSVQQGTYTWKIEFKTTSSDERRVVHGHVNVLK